MPDLAQFAAQYEAPPSPVQQKELEARAHEVDLAHQTQQAQLLAAGFAQMQKRVAVARTMGRAQELVASGSMDEETAHQQALLENSPALFGDNPQVFTKVTTSLYSHIKQQQAVKDYQNEVQRLLTDVDPETGEPAYTTTEAMNEAYAKYGPAMVGESSRGYNPTSYLNTATRADVQRRAIQQRAEASKETTHRTELRIGAKKEEVDKQIASKENIAMLQDTTKRELAKAHETAVDTRNDKRIKEHRYEFDARQANIATRLKTAQLDPVKKARMNALAATLTAVQKELVAAREKAAGKKVGSPDQNHLTELLNTEGDLTRQMEALLPAAPIKPRRLVSRNGQLVEEGAPAAPEAPAIQGDDSTDEE